MGYIRHDAVIVVVWEDETITGLLNARIEALRQEMDAAFRPLVIGPIETPVNGDTLYAFLPDGSKEGWPESDKGDEYRAKFIDCFEVAKWPNGIHVEFGGDEPQRVVTELLYQRGSEE